MRAQLRPRRPQVGVRQRGQAMLLTVLLLGVGVSVIVYNFVTPAQHSIERDRITAAALVEARDALIGRAASDQTIPGSLPCPDFDDGTINALNAANDGIADLLAGTECPSYVGRLPWRTLGVPDLRDGSGERLWYVLSPNFRDHPSASPLNSDTAGQLTITGTTPASNVIAIVFAPGAAVESQARDGPTNQNDVANYLECGNKDGDATYVTTAAGCILNDKLLAVTKEKLMSVVEMRVLRTMRAALVAYVATPGNGYPFANPYSESTNYECAYLQTEGRFPVKIKTPSVLSGCMLYADWGPELPAWFGNNLWQTVSYYSVDPCKVGSVTGTIELDRIALCVLGIPPKVDGTVKDAVVLVGSSALAAVAGQTPRPCGARSACFEAPNLSGNAFVTPPRSSTNNDRLTSVP